MGGNQKPAERLIASGVLERPHGGPAIVATRRIRLSPNSKVVIDGIVRVVPHLRVPFFGNFGRRLSQRPILIPLFQEIDKSLYLCDLLRQQRVELIDQSAQLVFVRSHSVRILAHRPGEFTNKIFCARSASPSSTARFATC